MSHLRRHTPLRSAATAGFTLVELLLVVAILGILASVAVVQLGGLGEDAKIKATQASISAIQTAVGTYEVTTTTFPQSIDDLTRDQPDGRPPLLDKNKINDQWGTPIQYKKLSKYKYEIRSAGPDGKFGTEDDLTN